MPEKIYCTTILMTSHQRIFWDTASNFIRNIFSKEIMIVMTKKAEPLWEEYSLKFPENVRPVFVEGEYLQKKTFPFDSILKDASNGLYFLCVHNRHEKLTHLYYDNVFEIAASLRLSQCRGILPNGDIVEYSVNGDPNAYDKKFKRFKDAHVGKRAFVVGNGPSLNKIPPSYLKNEITFCSNRVYLSFDKMGFNFQYYAIQNPITIDKWKDELTMLPAQMIKFFPDSYRDVFKTENTYFIRFSFPKTETENRFKDDINQFIYGKTVTYLLLQLAVYMGCDPIVLIGVDHEWVPQKDETDGNIYCRKNYHFDPKYEEGLGRQPIPNSGMMVEDYQRVRAWGDQHGRTIVNASAETKLDVFPTVRFDSLKFNRNSV